MHANVIQSMKIFVLSEKLFEKTHFCFKLIQIVDSGGPLVTRNIESEDVPILIGVVSWVRDLFRSFVLFNCKNFFLFKGCWMCQSRKTWCLCKSLISSRLDSREYWNLNQLSEIVTIRLENSFD